jgi:hypothetical protein
LTGPSTRLVGQDDPTAHRPVESEDIYELNELDTTDQGTGKTANKRCGGYIRDLFPTSAPVIVAMRKVKPTQRYSQVNNMVRSPGI